MKRETHGAQALPFYLAIQATILVMTFLDSPVYIANYHFSHYLQVTPWALPWLVLLIFGLVFGISALVRKDVEGNRQKVAAGYLLGVLAGFVTLGIRFMPVLPREYFYVLGALTLLYLSAYFAFRMRVGRNEELFP